MRVSESRDQEEYFKEMQAMSYAYHQRKEKVALRMGYREPRKTVDQLKVEMEAQEKVVAEKRKEHVAKLRAEKEVFVSPYIMYCCSQFYASTPSLLPLSPT